MLRIGIFGGSFDPVHNEHIQLARCAIAELKLDKLLVMPAGVPPHKQSKQLSSPADRLELCRIAFAPLPQVAVSDFEIARGGTSYTYQTCEFFARELPDCQLFWLVGTDMLRDFPTWRYPERILACATLAVCGRNEKADWLEGEQQAFYEKYGVHFHFLPYAGKDVSSTKLRVLAGAGMRLTDFTPENVAAYIEEKGLYKIPFAAEALALENPERRAHSIRVACLAASKAVKLKMDERKAITAALFHDCAKNLPADSPYLKGFSLPTEWGAVPKEVVHQFAGAYVAEHTFGVADEDILNAIRYHTSGRENMSDLEKLVFLADMLEEERSYEGVDRLRELFGKDLDECLKTALCETLVFLRKKGGEIYPLTQAAYAFYAK